MRRAGGAGPGVNNIAFGTWRDVRKRRSPGRPGWRTWIETRELLVPGAETVEDVGKRALQALEAMVAANRGGTFAVVTHRTVLNPLLARCITIASPYFWKVHMDTASYSVLHHTEGRGFSLYALNRTNHLSGYVTEWE